MSETYLIYLHNSSHYTTFKEQTSTKIVDMVDSGLVVVVCITSSLIVIVFSLLLYVEYEWCHVFFKNNTVNIYLHFLHYVFFSLSSMSMFNREPYWGG